MRSWGARSRSAGAMVCPSTIEPAHATDSSFIRVSAWVKVALAAAGSSDLARSLAHACGSATSHTAAARLSSRAGLLSSRPTSTCARPSFQDANSASPTRRSHTCPSSSGSGGGCLSRILTVTTGSLLAAEIEVERSPHPETSGSLRTLQLHWRGRAGIVRSAGAAGDRGSAC
jgi:hypothetical protein